MTDEEISHGAIRLLYPSSARQHVYSNDELKAVRSALGITGRWPDQELHKHLDALAYLMSLQIFVDRRFPGRKPLDVNVALLEPAKTLLKSIDSRQCQREFLQLWGGYNNFEADTFRTGLVTFIRRTERHIEAIRRRARKGVTWDSELKYLFIHNLACLCEYLDEEFEPTRDESSHKGFRYVADVLGRPLFSKTGGKEASFRGAIRKHVDGWNSGKRALQQEGIAMKRRAKSQKASLAKKGRRKVITRPA